MALFSHYPRTLLCFSTRNIHKITGDLVQKYQLKHFLNTLLGVSIPLKSKNIAGIHQRTFNGNIESAARFTDLSSTLWNLIFSFWMFIVSTIDWMHNKVLLYETCNTLLGIYRHRLMHCDTWLSTQTLPKDLQFPP